MYNGSKEHLRNLAKARKKSITDYNGSEKHLANMEKARKKAVAKKVTCNHCCKEISSPGFYNHERNCYLNPSNLKLCPVCTDPIKGYRYSETCSVACSNKFKPKRSATAYRTICFQHHPKKCIICDEENIVSVHHFDENHTNDDPSNLVPLCPTHHQYVHSRFSNMVLPSIRKYLNNWSG